MVKQKSKPKSKPKSLKKKKSFKISEKYSEEYFKDYLRKRYYTPIVKNINILCEPMLGTNEPLYPLIVKNNNTNSYQCPYVFSLPVNLNELPTDYQQIMYAVWIRETRQYINNLNDDERKILYRYTNDYYKKINRKFYYNFRLGNVKNEIETLDKIIYNAPRPKFEFYIWRGTGPKWWGSKNEIDFEPENTFIIKTFSSFSTNIESSIAFLEKKHPSLIKLKLSSNIPHLLSISAFDDKEHEILFPRNTTFKRLGKSYFLTKQQIEKIHEPILNETLVYDMEIIP